MSLLLLFTVLASKNKSNHDNVDNVTIYCMCLVFVVHEKTLEEPFSFMYYRDVPTDHAYIHGNS